MPTPLRLLLVASLVTAAGCAAIQRSIMAGDPKTYAPARDLVKEKKFTEAAAELRRLQVELAPDTKAKYSFTTYGDLVADVARALVLEPLDLAESAVQKPERRGEAALALAKLPDAFKAIEGLPLDGLGSEKYALKTLNERRAKIEAAAAALAAGADKQLALIHEDEKAGRTGFALYEWSRFIPANEAQLKERDTKLLELARQLFNEAGGRFGLVLAKGGAANLGAGIVDGKRRALARLGTVAFTPSKEADVVLVHGAPSPQVKRTSGTVKLEWKYPTGKKEVDNPDYAKLQEKIARLDKESKWQKEKYDNTNCGTGGSVKGRTKFPGGDCAKAYYQSWQKYTKDAEAARKSLSRTKPRKLETVYSTYAYDAREDVVSVEQTVNVEVTYKDGRKTRLSKVATMALKAYTHPGHAPVKLKARAEKLASDEVVLNLFQPKIGDAVFEFIQQAQVGLLADEKKKLEGKSDDAAIAEYRLRVLAQRMFKDPGSFDVEARAVKARLGEPLQDGPKLPDLFKLGVDSLTWDRLVAFAEAEEADKRVGSAYLAWALTTPFDDASRTRRPQKVAELKARLAEDRVLAWNADAQGATGEITKKLGDLLAPLPGFPKAAGEPRLRLTLSAPAPKLERESGDVTLEHEYAIGEEEIENPAWVEQEAKRAACYESGDAMCITMWEMMPASSLTETIKQPILQLVTYTARRDAVELSSEVSVKAAFDGRELAFNVPVKHLVEAFAHPAKADAKLAARAEKLPADAALVAAWEDVAAKAVFDAILEKLHTAEGGPAGAVLNGALLKALRLKAGKDANWNLFDDLAKEILAVDVYRRGGVELP